MNQHWIFTRHYTGLINGVVTSVRPGEVKKLSPEDEARIKAEAAGTLFPAEDPGWQRGSDELPAEPKPTA